jgi:hypothetical protein
VNHPSNPRTRLPFSQAIFLIYPVSQTNESTNESTRWAGMKKLNNSGMNLFGKHSVIKSNAIMAGTHCAQCSDTRNIYIKTCDCSKKQVNQEIGSKPNSDKKDLNNISAVDTNKQPEEPKLKAVKAVLYKVVRYVFIIILYFSINYF